MIPDDVGGRFTVLTPVGLLPIAVSGADIDRLMEGANDARKEYGATSDLKKTKPISMLRYVTFYIVKAKQLKC